MALINLPDEKELPEQYQPMLYSIAPKDEIPEEYRNFVHEGPLSLYRVLSKNPPLLAAFRQYAGAIWEHITLDSYQREIVCLTVISELGVEYEWQQHVPIAIAEGMIPGEIIAIHSRQFDNFPDSEETLIRYVRAFVTGTVDDEIHKALCEYHSEQSIVEICTLASVYMMTCSLMQALDVAPETPFIGWNLENVKQD